MSGFYEQYRAGRLSDPEFREHYDRHRTDDLRTALIEAGARALSEVICGDEICTLDDGCMADHETEAEAALDAFLDVLADRADEWCEGSYDTKMLDRGIPLELIAVLREGDEQ